MVLKRRDFVIAGASISGAQEQKECEEKGIAITHRSHQDLLGVEADIICIGVNFGARGKWVIEALKLGKHVLSDKPFCTAQSELKEIKRQLHNSPELQLFAQLDLRQQGILRSVRSIVRAGDMGKVLSVNISANHPLCSETRPEWYWESKKHGGTINDIGSHCFDIIPWITGVPIKKITGAYTGTTITEGKHKKFPNIGQVQFALEDNSACMVDLSYTLPDAFGYSYKGYWKFLFWCEKGVLEFGLNSQLMKHIAGESDPIEIAFLPYEGTILDEFIRAINGNPASGDLTSEASIIAAEYCLIAQELADSHN